MWDVELLLLAYTIQNSKLQQYDLETNLRNQNTFTSLEWLQPNITHPLPRVAPPWEGMGRKPNPSTLTLPPSLPSRQLSLYCSTSVVVRWRYSGTLVACI
jgi:hypothetical protein